MFQIILQCLFYYILTLYNIEKKTTKNIQKIGNYILLKIFFFVIKILLLKNNEIFTPDSNNFAKRHIDFPQLSNEDGRHSFIQGGAVHVDGSADGDHEACDARIQAHVVATTNCYGHCC